jgi:hypothetical protein
MLRGRGEYYAKAAGVCESEEMRGGGGSLVEGELPISNIVTNMVIPAM